MDLLKLVAELREYRAQVEEAIASLEELSGRRTRAGTDAKIPAKRSQRRGPVKAKRRAGKNKSR
jgi:hypothetical protein